MKIEVNYDRETQIRERIWNITKHFTKTKFENIVNIPVHFPKAAKSPLEIMSETLNGTDVNTDEACEKLTGLTATQYQARHGVAWND